MNRQPFLTDTFIRRIAPEPQASIFLDARQYWVHIRLRVFTEDVANAVSFSVRSSTMPGSDDGIVPNPTEWTDLILAPGQVLYVNALANARIQAIVQGVPIAEYLATTNELLLKVDLLIETMTKASKAA